MPLPRSPSDLFSPAPYRKAKVSRRFAAEGRFLLPATLLPASLLPASVLLAACALTLAGCKTFHLEHHDYVYVAARQVYLHDRVAAVSNRVGLVTNGEALEVVERGKRFVKVKTPKGEVGWIEDHAIIDDKLFAQFEDLNKKHAQDPVVANAELRDDLYLHVLPGRESPHFLLIPGNAKVQLLARGTVEKTASPGSAAPSKPRPPRRQNTRFPAACLDTIGHIPSRSGTIQLPIRGSHGRLVARS